MGTPTTTSTVQTAFRLPSELINRIDAQVSRLRKRLPGVRLSRADVVRSLLARGLQEAERER